jgi:hypothetical protein
MENTRVNEDQTAIQPNQMASRGFTPGRGGLRARWQGRRGQSSGRGRGEGRNEERNLNFVTPPNIDRTSNPVPKALSTTETSLRNDPMWQDFETEGFEGLIPYRARNEFSVTFEGFVSLVEREYDLLNSADRNFTKHVSKSMFVWYSVQHAHARCIPIKMHSAENAYEEELFLNYMRCRNWIVLTPHIGMFPVASRNTPFSKDPLFYFIL